MRGTEKAHQRTVCKANKILTLGFLFLKEMNEQTWIQFFSGKDPKEQYIRQKIANYVRKDDVDTPRCRWQVDSIQWVCDLFGVGFSDWVLIGEALQKRGIEPFEADEGSKGRIRRYAMLMKDTRCPLNQLDKYLDLIVQKDKVLQMEKELGLRDESSSLCG